MCNEAFMCGPITDKFTAFIISRCTRAQRRVEAAAALVHVGEAHRNAAVATVMGEERQKGEKVSCRQRQILKLTGYYYVFPSKRKERFNI